MKELIEKININREQLESAIKHLSEGDNNGLWEFELSHVVRYLLLRIVELENEINNLKSEA